MHANLSENLGQLNGGLSDLGWTRANTSFSKLNSLSNRPKREMNVK